MTEVLYTYDEALNLISNLLQNKKTVLGIERVILIDGKLIPDLNGIADYSPNGVIKKHILIKYFSDFGKNNNERFIFLFENR